MLRVTVFFLGLIAAFSAGAQINDTAFAAVRYSFVYLSDTTMPPETENMILLLGKNTSLYKSYDRMFSDSVIKAQMESYKNAPPGTPMQLGMAGMKRGNGSAVYKDVANNRMLRQENFIKDYIIDDAMPAINWNMASETKNIQELVCQKATGSFRGRNYTAWFTTQLPYSNGPWKLGGLPGLIVEAYDDEKQVVFKFESFENVGHRKIPIALPAEHVRATAKEYKQLRELADKDREGFMKSRMAEMQNSNATAGNISGGTITVVGGSSRAGGGGSSKRRVLNNPIERSEN